jgi:hypothetical protein
MNDESSELFFILLAEMISSFFSTSGDGCCIEKKKKKKIGKSPLQQCFFPQISGPTMLEMMSNPSMKLLASRCKSKNFTLAPTNPIF